MFLYYFLIFLKKSKLMEGIILTIILGAVAGWLGSKIYSGRGLGLIGNIIVGIIGGFLGYWGLGKLGINLGSGYVGYILTAAVGAIALLFIINLVSNKR